VLAQRERVFGGYSSERVQQGERRCGGVEEAAVLIIKQNEELAAYASGSV